MGNTITLEALGGGQPSQLLLPAGGSYTNANASIMGASLALRCGYSVYSRALSNDSQHDDHPPRRFPSGQALTPLFQLFPGVVPPLWLFRSPVRYRSFLGVLGLWALRRKRKAPSAKAALPAFARGCRLLPHPSRLVAEVASCAAFRCAPASRPERGAKGDFWQKRPCANAHGCVRDGLPARIAHIIIVAVGLQHCRSGRQGYKTLSNPRTLQLRAV